MSLTDVDGIRVGHWSDFDARTGCTVVLFPEDTVVSGEVRGNAPATREYGLLAPHRTVQGANAAFLSGGSAYGLAVGDGVMAWCEEHGVGFETPAGIVPIVPGFCCFDLGVGDASVRPTAESGYAACEAASDTTMRSGRVGAGTGATIGKWHDVAEKVDSGLGCATERSGDLVVSAAVACNAVGYIGDRRDLDAPFWSVGTNTSIGIIVTNACLAKTGCYVLAQSGHDGLARVIDPVHTGLDGDALLAAATGAVDADLDLVRALGARAVESAVRSIPLGPS